jgi:hypothetical protein
MELGIFIGGTPAGAAWSSRTRRAWSTTSSSLPAMETPQRPHTDRLLPAGKL